MKKFGIFLLVAVFAVAGVLAVRMQSTKDVQFASAQYGDLSLAVELEGSAQRDVKLPIASAYGGTVTKLVTEGQQIKKGDILLEVDDGTKAEIAKAEQELKAEQESRDKKLKSMRQASTSQDSQARAQKVIEEAIQLRSEVIEKAQNEWAEYEVYNTAVENVLNATTLEVMAPVTSDGADPQAVKKVDVSSNDKKIDWINSALSKLSGKLDDLRTISDIEGVVLRVDVKEGNTLNEGEVALVVGSEGYVISAVADSDELEQIKPNMEARITQDGRTWRSKVIGTEGNRVLIAPPESFAAKDGSVVNVKVLTATASDTIKLPVECVASDDSGEYVLVAEGGKLQRRDVVTGIRDDYTVTIVEGLGVAEQCAYYPEQYEEGERYKG